MAEQDRELEERAQRLEVDLQRRVPPGRQLKAAHKFLYSRQETFLQLDVGFIDVLEIREYKGRLMQGDQPEEKPAFHVTDSFVLGIPDAIELIKTAQYMAEDLERAGLIVREKESKGEPEL